MKSIPQQEAEGLAHSLPWEQSELWGSAVFMVGAMPPARSFTLRVYPLGIESK